MHLLCNKYSRSWFNRALARWKIPMYLKHPHRAPATWQQVNKATIGGLSTSIRSNYLDASPHILSDINSCIACFTIERPTKWMLIIQLNIRNEFKIVECLFSTATKPSEWRSNKKLPVNICVWHLLMALTSHTTSIQMALSQCNARR